MSANQDDFYVNRHGKKMSLDGATLETPPPEEKVVLPQASVLKPTKARPPRKKRPVKKMLLIFLVFLIGIVLIPVIGGELVRARYVSSRDGARAQLMQFATGTVVPQQKKQVTVTQLSEAATRVEKIRDDACDGGLTDNLAVIYPRAKSAFDECIVLKQKIDAIAVSLRSMESQARYLEALEPIVSPIAKAPTEEFAIISAQLANWQALSDALGKLSPAASQRSTHDQLKLQAKAITDAWSALNTANDNQDSQAFADAEKKLGEAYETFRTSSSSLAGVLNDTQSKLTASYKAL